MDYRTKLKSSRFWVMTCRRLAGYREHHEIAALALQGGAEAIVMREDAFEEEEFPKPRSRSRKSVTGKGRPF